MDKDLVIIGLLLVVIFLLYMKRTSGASSTYEYKAPSGVCTCSRGTNLDANSSSASMCWKASGSGGTSRTYSKPSSCQCDSGFTYNASAGTKSQLCKKRIMSAPAPAPATTTPETTTPPAVAEAVTAIWQTVTI